MSTVPSIPVDEGLKLRAVPNADDRQEVYDAPGDPQEQFRSVGAIIPVGHHHMQEKEGKWVLVASRLDTTYPVHYREPFRHQPTVAVGAAFLVHPQVVLTAHHVVPSPQIARRVRLVFGYQAKPDGSVPSAFPPEDVYEMTPIWSNPRHDVALFMLDRAVRDTNDLERKPLKARLDREVGDDEELYVLGFPLGLPGKYAGNGTVIKKTSAFFTAELDVQRGNSGSPVFSAKTQEVVGVLSTAPLGLTPVTKGVFASDFTRNEGDVAVGISKITNVWMRP